jgi:hypothetical protein
MVTKLIAVASAVAGVAITALAAHKAIQSTDNINRICREIEKYERDHTFKVSGRVYNAWTNTEYFEEPEGKRKLIKALKEEGFYNIEIFYHDEDKMIIDCYTTDDEFKSLIMADIIPLETDDELSEEDSLYKL